MQEVAMGMALPARSTGNTQYGKDAAAYHTAAGNSYKFT